MLEWLRSKLTLKTISVVVPIITGIAAASAAVTQAWFPPTTLPGIQAGSIAELREQVEERRQALQTEIETLDALLEDIGRAESALVGKASPEAASVDRTRSDAWWISALKTVAVYFVLFFSATLSIVAFVADLIALAFGHEFPVLRGMWSWSWQVVFLDWYWARTTVGGTVMGVVLIGLTSALGRLFEMLDERSQRAPTPDE